MEKRKRKKFRTFTKRAVMAILFVALIDLQFSYLLAFLGREQIAENLSSDITKVIIGTILGYLAKSFFETREEEWVRLEEQASDRFTAAASSEQSPPHEWRNGE